MFGSPRYSDPKIEFRASIIDFVEGKKFEISNEKLESELNKISQSLPHIKKDLKIDILMNKGFNARTLRELLSFLPIPEVEFPKEKVKKGKRMRAKERDHSD